MPSSKSSTGRAPSRTSSSPRSRNGLRLRDQRRAIFVGGGLQLAGDRQQLVERGHQRRRERAAVRPGRRCASISVGASSRVAAVELALAVRGDRQGRAAGVDRLGELARRAAPSVGEEDVELVDQLGQQPAALVQRPGERRRGVGQLAELAEDLAQLRLAAAAARSPPR